LYLKTILFAVKKIKRISRIQIHFQYSRY